MTLHISVLTWSWKDQPPTAKVNFEKSTDDSENTTLSLLATSIEDL